MKNIVLRIDIKEYQMEELTDEERKLVNKAIGATNNSYAPYSNFHVGAALLLNNGQIVIGANQENAAFPSGLCAERTALFAAQANYPDQPVRTIAIAARSKKQLVENAVSPCGQCRQAMIEVENRYKQPITVLLCGAKGIYKLNSVGDLLPLSFVESSME